MSIVLDAISKFSPVFSTVFVLRHNDRTNANARMRIGLVVMPRIKKTVGLFWGVCGYVQHNADSVVNQESICSEHKKTGDRNMQFLRPDKIMPEFVDRTLKNLRSQRSLYDVTQFINSLVGLLILPKESAFDSIEDSDVSASLLQEIQNKVTICKKGDQDEKKDLRNIVKHLRNGICHWHVDFYGSNYIEKIQIQDFTPNSQIQTFNGQFEVELLKKFVFEFSTNMAQKMKNNNVSATKGGN